MSTNPWLTINDMLIKNRCWLCEDVFQRGKVKKVFQVSALLEYFDRRLRHETIAPDKPQDGIDSSNNEDISSKDAFKAKNLRNCYEHYKAVIGNDKEANAKKFLDILKDNDIELWMSGLICGSKDACKEEMAHFIVDAPTTATSSTKSSKNSPFTFANKDNKDCPPGCNCDNPWPFLS